MLFAFRFLGYVLDAVIVGGIPVGLITILSYLMWGSLTTAALAASIAGVVAWFCYQYFCITRWQATLGMRVATVRVQPTEGSIESAAIRRGIFFALVSSPSILVCVLRGTPGSDFASICAWAVQLLFYVSCLAVRWTKPPRAMHDNWTKTSVVQVAGQYLQRPNFFRREVAIVWILATAGVLLIAIAQIHTIIRIFNALYSYF